MDGKFRVGDIVERTSYKIDGSCLFVGCKMEVIEIVKEYGVNLYRCRVLEGSEKGKTFRLVSKKIKDIKKNNLRW